MPDTSRPTTRSRQRELRHDLIVTTARRLAERDGWDRVTTRRLAEAIEHSQPVLYGHFPQGKTQIMAVVARQGFAELTDAMEARAADGASAPAERLVRTAQGYLDFAAAHPATYDAMFGLPTELRFADGDPPAELGSAFEALLGAVGTRGDDPESRAEVLWATLHGLALLDRETRTRPDARAARLRTVIELFLPT